MKKRLLIGFTILIIAFLGCKEGTPPPEPEPGPFKLIITGIPGGTVITGEMLVGALLEENVLETQKPAAVGFHTGGGVISLYELKDEEELMPDLGKPWMTKGEYYIGLSIVEMKTNTETSKLEFEPKEYYVYTDGNKLIEIDFEKFVGKIIVAWANPAKRSVLEQFLTEVLAAIEALQNEEEDFTFEESFFEDNAEAIEILTGFATESSTINIKKFDIRNENTTIAWGKFKPLDEDVIFAEIMGYITEIQAILDQLP